jgi:hypothetical protein
MGTRPGRYAVMLLNLALLTLALAQQFRPALAQQELPVLRGRALEIFDAQVAFAPASASCRRASP